jgi:acyl-CoA thioester hydrolase
MSINAASIPADGRHRYAIRVYYEDTDSGGVVYHANYLRFAERARTEALRDLGIPHAELVERFGLMFMVHRVEVDYVRGARLDDALTVETEVLEVGGASTILRQTVRNADGVCVVAVIRLACVRITDSKPGRVPERWREGLMAMKSGRFTSTSWSGSTGPCIEAGCVGTDGPVKPDHDGRGVPGHDRNGGPYRSASTISEKGT